MKTYNVHLYREMRLTFTGIEAATPEAAAKHASGLPTEDADAIDDCDGQDFGALVDRQGDEEHEHSVLIDFEEELMGKAARELLEALEEVCREIEHWHGDMLTEEERRPPRGSGWARVYDKAQAAIARARECGS